jgi:hypothetical protein
MAKLSRFWIRREATFNPCGSFERRAGSHVAMMEKVHNLLRLIILVGWNELSVAHSLHSHSLASALLAFGS